MIFSRFNGVPAASQNHKGRMPYRNGSIFSRTAESSEPFKILFITSSFKSLGGAEKNLIDLMNGLNSVGFHCYLAVLQGGPLVKRVQQSGLNVLEFGLAKILSPEGIRKGFQLASFLRRERVKAVITYHVDADLWGGIFARLARVPLLISSRRDMGYLLQAKHIRCYRLLNRFFTHFISVSDAVKGEIAKREGISLHKITTIYNGVDLSNQRVPVNRAGKKRHMGFHPDTPIVGTIASFRPIKGQEYFIETASRILEKRPEVQFLIVGGRDADYFSKIQNLIHERGIQKSVHCLGERRDIAALLPIFDVYVSTSLQEGFSNALIEAMSCEVPVVASDVGGNAEAIRQAETGFLVKPKDVDGFANAILGLLNNPALRVQMAWAARREVIHHFSFENMIKNTSELITRLYQSEKAKQGV